MAGTTSVKIFLLANGSSVHTVRWANALSEAGMDIVLATQDGAADALKPSIEIRQLPFSGGAGYFRNVTALKRLLLQERPDILHAHYASGYGTAARLSGFRPLLVSVWGSDVFDFPKRSPLHKWLLRGNLMAATQVASTSQTMAEQTRHIAPRLGEIAVTPFGVDTGSFATDSPAPTAPDAPIIIGTVKVLREKYGIDTFIDSIALLVGQLRQRAPVLAGRIRARIVGDGPQREELEKRVADLGIGDIVHFVGSVPHEDVPEELRKFDIYMALSREESFGVAIIEAGACGLPVVVSDAGGLPEVVSDGETGFVVPRENPQAAAEVLGRLVLDADLRARMGRAGRDRVVSLYEWKDNVQQMINLYEKVIGGFQAGRRQ